jgi:hypothetical protein
MSEIPYVNQLGDALDEAIAKRARTRRMPRLGRRRYLAVALAALAVGGGGAAIAGLVTDPVEIGFGAVGCFEGPEPDGNVAVLTDPTRSPLRLCAAAPGVGVQPRDLIACSWEDHGVVVLTREGRGSCSARGLAPLPPSYRGARLRASRLQAVAVEFESTAGCLAPSEFARRLTADLRRRGFADWRAAVDGRKGPCGRVSVPTGSSVVGSLAGAVDATHRTVNVRGEAPLDLELILSQPGSPGVRLFDSSGERCFTLAGLEEHVRRALAVTDVPIRFRHRSLQSFVEVAPPRGDRYAEGCAIYEGASFEYPDGRIEIVADLSQRDAPRP